MADLIESMFYVNEIPWHGKGVPLKNPPSIDDGLKLAGLDWKVDKYPTSYQIPHLNSHFSTGHYVIVRTDNYEVVGNVGERYTPLQNKDAFQPFEPMLDWGYTLETAGSIDNGKRVWILAKAPENLTVGDETILPYVLLYTSHDGSTGNCFRDTLIRVVCNNTLEYALEKKGSYEYSIRHTTSVKDRIHELRTSIEKSRGNVKEAVTKMNQMMEHPFNENQAGVYFEHVIPFLAHRGAKSDKDLGIKRRDVATPVFEQLINNFHSGRGNNGESLWHAYNAITEYYDHQKEYKDWVKATQFGKASDYKRRAFYMANQILNTNNIYA